MEPPIDRRAFRLLPSERVLWHGRRTPGVPLEPGYRVAVGVAAALAAVAALFSVLLWVAELPGVKNTGLLAMCFAIGAIGVSKFPSFWLASCEYAVTDRRVIWRRGRLRRAIERHGITYGRIRWNPRLPRVGHLELVRATPFGPLSRRQRVVLNDIEAADVVFALIRGIELGPSAGASDVALIDRLDPDEEVLWGGHPEGWLVGWQELATAVVGAGLTVLGLFYAHRVGSILLGLEASGLPVRSPVWLLFFLAVSITTLVIVGAGVGLIWHGAWRSRRLGRQTEYVLTNRRLLIRRGRTELSVDRARIVDVADAPASGGLHHLFLVLDAPESRALSVSGALGPTLPARDSVPPVLFELREAQPVKDLILSRGSRPSFPPLSDAA